jgi:hypothetical protein
MHYTKYLGLLLLCLALCNRLNAQVPVYEEPRHKPVLVNDHIRLLDVHLNPGDTTFFHVHAKPSVFVYFTTTVTQTQIKGEAFSQPAKVATGYTRFTDYEKQPITHRVYNADTNVFHVMDIELMKKGASFSSCDVLQGDNVEKTIDEKLVRMYKLDVSAQHSIDISEGSCAHLLICVSGYVTTSEKQLKTGEYIFFDSNKNFSVHNNQSDNSLCVLIELK